VANDRRVMNAAALIMPAMVLSRITGFLREQLLPVKMGKELSQAFLTAYILPDLMYSLLVGGAIGAAIIPVLSGYIAKKDEETGWRAIGSFVNLIFVIMVVACIFGMIFTPELIKIVAIGYGENIEMQEMVNLTVKITRILFPSITFMMLAGMCNGILNSYHKFVAAAYGPVLYNVLCTISIIVFADGTEKGLIVTANGIMFSTVAYFLLQLAFVAKKLRYFRFEIMFRDEIFIRVLKLAIPALMASTIVQVNIMLSRVFVTALEFGRLTLLNMADKIWQVPLGIFAQSIATTMLPALSAHYAAGETKEYSKTLFKSIKVVLTLSIPSAIGIIVLSSQVMSTLFKYGKIQGDDILYSSTALMVYSLALIYQSVVYIINRAFYSVSDTKTPMITGAVSVIVNFILNIIFLNFTNLDLVGMALSYVISVAINCFVLTIIFGKKININIIQVLSPFLLKLLGASLIMGAILFLTRNLFLVSTDSKLLSSTLQIISLGFNVLLGALIFGILGLLFKIDTVKSLLVVGLKKLKVI